MFGVLHHKKMFSYEYISIFSFNFNMGKNLYLKIVKILAILN